MIVTGGTLRENSRRLVETKDQLEDVTNQKYCLQLQEALSQGLPEIKAVLDEWQSLDIHIVGSGEYVYQSGALSKDIEDLRETVIQNISQKQDDLSFMIKWGVNTLPRTFGLRDSVKVALLRLTNIPPTLPNLLVTWEGMGAEKLTEYKGDINCSTSLLIWLEKIFRDVGGFPESKSLGSLNENGVTLKSEIMLAYIHITHYNDSSFAQKFAKGFRLHQNLHPEYSERTQSNYGN